MHGWTISFSNKHAVISPLNVNIYSEINWLNLISTQKIFFNGCAIRSFILSFGKKIIKEGTSMLKNFFCGFPYELKSISTPKFLYLSYKTYYLFGFFFYVSSVKGTSKLSILNSLILTPLFWTISEGTNCPSMYTFSIGIHFYSLESKYGDTVKNV